MKALEYILKENVLTDDILSVAPIGYKFKGGFIAIVEMFTYMNAWGDKKEVVRFRTEKSLNAFLNNHYPESMEYLDLI